MEDLYILTYLFEDGSGVEKSFTAETLEWAIMLATSFVKGGEGLLSCIELSDGISTWTYDYSECSWEVDPYEF